MMMLVRVNAGDRNVCPTCARLSGDQSVVPFESEWKQRAPDLSGWTATAGPDPAHTHSRCRCQLWQYESVAAPKPPGWGMDVNASAESGWVASSSSGSW